MPILKNAIKKMRQDAKKTKVNLANKTRLKTTIAKAKKTASVENLSAAFSLLDRASKRGLIHKNKAARAKGRLAKFLKTNLKEAVVSTKKSKVSKKKAAV